tara:strand:+ start:476 stop:2359 length:1884 start_codon:yes stop_codon:yes gene_type:complete
MAQTSEKNVLNLIAAKSKLDVLRFITCGSIDDGKSTLLGQMLCATDEVKRDHFAELKVNSAKHGTQGREVDYALLLDGLSAEQEQGITIDIAYRFFSTNRRKFIAADTPGHEEYTRNMVTAASTAQLAILLIDASRGLLEQTRRHSHIVSLLGVKKIVLAINKMDLIGYDHNVFNTIVEEYRAFSRDLGFESIIFMPVSALDGDNVLERSANTPWYKGPPLLEYLEIVSIQEEEVFSAFTMPVQWVNRRTSDFRGYAGMVMSGVAYPKDEIKVLPSGQTTSINQILLGGESLEAAESGQSITITLDKEINIARGDIIVASDSSLECSDQFNASLVWMTSTPGFAGRSYWFLLGTLKVGATITSIRYKYDLALVEKVKAQELKLNDISEVTIKLDRPVPFTTYSVNRHLGGFVLADRYNYNNIAIGMINHSLRRAQSIKSQNLTIDRLAREKLNGHRGKVFWMTGLSGSGKSTIADAFEGALHLRGVRTYILDGDNIRGGLSKDLGFVDSDRIENSRRVAEVAKLLVDAGLVVIIALISPFRPERHAARELFENQDFVEVYVDVALSIAEQRDTKGLYLKARNGELPNFTGIDSAYEAPVDPDVHLNTMELTVDQCVERMLEYMFAEE